jgi:septal ring factor EnvC (AmiA/AmiB activator)
VLAALDLIPDSLQTGPLNEVILIGGVVGALAIIGRLIVLPMWRWLVRLAVGIETAVDRLSDVADHTDRIDKIEKNISEIHEALRPTNGDRRSVSDRLDTVKQQTNKNADEIRALRVDLSRINEGTTP